MLAARRGPALVLAACYCALALIVSGKQQALAAGIYPTGATGDTLSYPQCGDPLTTPPHAFAIVGVTGGRAFYQNPCLVGEYAWAQKASVAPSLYLNLNAPAGTTAFKAQSGPKGACAAADQNCQSYNYGFNAAQAAFADAQSQSTTGTTWWLDVESSNTWSSVTSQNDQVIQGAIDFLRGQGVRVGVYSTAQQWAQIAGTFNVGLPVWVAGASDAAHAPSYCAASYAFGGGPVWLVQYPTSGFDAIYACPASTPSAQPVPAPLAPPENVQATAIDTGDIRLTWALDSTLGSSGVVIYDGANQLTVNAPATSYTAGNLAPGSYHCYTMLAFGSVGYSGWTSWACATTPAS